VGWRTDQRSRRPSRRALRKCSRVIAPAPGRGDPCGHPVCVPPGSRATTRVAPTSSFCRHKSTVIAFYDALDPFRLAEVSSLPSTELLAHRRARGGSAVVLVAEDDAAFFEIVGRHFHDDAIAGQRLDPVLLHLAGRVGDDLMAGIELYPV